MPWELWIVKYDADSPREEDGFDEAHGLPLGTLDEIRVHFTEVFAGIEWFEEPPLLEVMGRTASELRESGWPE